MTEGCSCCEDTASHAYSDEDEDGDEIADW